jgi:hypothetical protein
MILFINVHIFDGSGAAPFCSLMPAIALLLGPALAAAQFINSMSLFRQTRALTQIPMTMSNRQTSGASVPSEPSQVRLSATVNTQFDASRLPQLPRPGSRSRRYTSGRSPTID